MHVYSNVEILFGWFQIFNFFLQPLDKLLTWRFESGPFIVFYAIYWFIKHIIWFFLFVCSSEFVYFECDFASMFTACFTSLWLMDELCFEI